VSDEHAGDNRGNDLDVEVAVKWQGGTRLRGCWYVNHYVLHRAATNYWLFPGALMSEDDAANGVPVFY
jgi:hypothetical protein